jgi:hypothetical protein
MCGGWPDGRITPENARQVEARKSTAQWPSDTTPKAIRGWQFRKSSPYVQSNQGRSVGLHSEIQEPSIAVQHRSLGHSQDAGERNQQHERAGLKLLHV